MTRRNGIGRLTLSLLLTAVSLGAQSRAIDVRKSVMTVRVYKAGVLSAFGHDHEISAPIASGKADPSAHTVELRVQSGALRVEDAKASEKDRAEIQKTMLGPEVLDAERHPEILFRSTGVEPAGSGGWTVRGNLSLHGQTRPVSLEVREKEGHYVGNVLLKQTDFGIKPVRVAGGTVKVKDQIRIEFEIQLAR
jgi:polyisoprenoid-binding protein YceI